MATQQNARRQRFRVVGSGYTIFSFDGKRLQFCQQIQDTPPQPVAPPTPVQPLDESHPIEIAFPRAAGPGQLTVTIIEQWDSDVWRQLPGYGRGVMNDIVDVFDRSANIGGVTCVKLIVPPKPYKKRAVQYHGCVITNLDLGETVSIEAMTVGKTITITYTHTSRVDKG